MRTITVVAAVNCRGHPQFPSTFTTILSRPTAADPSQGKIGRRSGKSLPAPRRICSTCESGKRTDSPGTAGNWKREAAYAATQLSAASLFLSF